MHRLWGTYQSAIFPLKPAAIQYVEELNPLKGRGEVKFKKEKKNPKIVK